MHPEIGRSGGQDMAKEISLRNAADIYILRIQDGKCSESMVFHDLKALPDGTVLMQEYGTYLGDHDLCDVHRAPPEYIARHPGKLRVGRAADRQNCRNAGGLVPFYDRMDLFFRQAVCCFDTSLRRARRDMYTVKNLYSSLEINNRHGKPVPVAAEKWRALPFRIYAAPQRICGCTIGLTARWLFRSPRSRPHRTHSPCRAGWR